MKRLFDLAIALIALPLAVSICIIVSLLIWLDIRAKPFLVQTRIGRNEVPFKIYKLRTMLVETEEHATHLISNERITPTGRVLRKAKIDELPQLWNVIRGEMSLVGPRPCLTSQHEVIEERRKRNIFSVLPGITGLAQLAGVDMSTPRELAELDEEYIKDWSIGKDLAILIKTAFGSGRGDPAQG